MKNRDSFTRFITALCELHDRELSEFIVRLYWKALEPFSDEQCEQAFETLILTARYFPKPVDIIEIIRGKTEDRAVLAWAEVERTLRRVGTYDSVRFHDRKIHAVIECMGGWVPLGETREEELKWKRREFERLYAVIQGTNGVPDHLPGRFELENRVNGGEIPAPVLIGAPEPKRIEDQP